MVTAEGDFRKDPSGIPFWVLFPSAVRDQPNTPRLSLPVSVSSSQIVKSYSGGWPGAGCIPREILVGKYGCRQLRSPIQFKAFGSKDLKSTIEPRLNEIGKALPR